MLAGLYVVRCYISCLPRLCSVLLHGEKKHKKWFMNINEQAGIPNLKVAVYSYAKPPKRTTAASNYLYIGLQL